MTVTFRLLRYHGGRLDFCGKWQFGMSKKSGCFKWIAKEFCRCRDEAPRPENVPKPRVLVVKPQSRPPEVVEFRDQGVYYRRVDEDNVGDTEFLINGNFPFGYNPKFYNDIVNGRSSALVAYDADTNEPVGCIVYSETYPPRDSFHILAICVQSTHRRRGIAYTLFRLSLQDSTTNISTLHVQTVNEGAIKLYRKLGFTYVETHKNYYHQLANPDAYVMQKTIDPRERQPTKDFPKLPPKRGRKRRSLFFLFTGNSR